MQRCISAPGEMAPQEGTTQFGHRDAHKKNRQHRIQTSSSLRKAKEIKQTMLQHEQQKHTVHE